VDVHPRHLGAWRAGLAELCGYLLKHFTSEHRTVRTLPGRCTGPQSRGRVRCQSEPESRAPKPLVPLRAPFGSTRSDPAWLVKPSQRHTLNRRVVDQALSGRSTCRFSSAPTTAKGSLALPRRSFPVDSYCIFKPTLPRELQAVDPPLRRARLRGAHKARLQCVLDASG
jgi:hypothetical protein